MIRRGHVGDPPVARSSHYGVTPSAQRRWHTSHRRFSRVSAAQLALCLCIAGGAACVDEESTGRSQDRASAGPIRCETRAPSVGGGGRHRWVVSHGRSIVTEPSPGAVPLLFDPVGVVPMGDGRLLVSDRGSRFVLNVMHAELDTVLARFARRGRGPGELGGAYSQLAVLPQNVVRVLDRMNRKELWFGADGDLLDERTIRDLGVRLGTMAYLGNEIVGERWTFSSMSEVAIDLMKLDSLGTTARVVELPRHPENWKPGEIQVGRPLWAVVGDNIVTGRSDLAEFAVYDALGQLVRTIRLDLSTREITAEEVRVEQALHPGLAYVFTPGKIAITNALYPFGHDAFTMLSIWPLASRGG